jgi:hypothetical protein
LGFTRESSALFRYYVIRIRVSSAFHRARDKHPQLFALAKDRFRQALSPLRHNPSRLTNDKDLVKSYKANLRW